MSSKFKNLRAFAASRETKNEEAAPVLVPKLRFPEFREKPHARREAAKKKEECNEF